MRPFFASSLLILISASGHAQAQAVRSTAPATIASLAPNAAATLKVIELDPIKVLSLSQGDGRAVLGVPDRQMVLFKAGDPVRRTRAVLIQDMADKVALDEKLQMASPGSRTGCMRDRAPSPAASSV